MRVWILGCLWMASHLWTPTSAAATSDAAAGVDTRVALLIAHQHGWRGDPTLRYVISGDLNPLQSILTKNGFQVIALQNPTPAQVRRSFRKLATRKDISTFLFYYSGHGGKRYFHLGRRQKRPLSHREFLRFFHKVRCQRRIALIDACFSGSLVRQWGRKKLDKWARLKAIPKGARRASFAILTKAKKYQNRLRGTHIIASSQSYSYESRRLKASVFTHYLLLGLRGYADLNSDGQVSVRELFGYIQPKVKQVAEQSPRRWAQVDGEDYGLTPNQTSHLLIPAKVLGKLRVTIGNFFWRYQKKRRHRIQLRVVHGQGTIELRKAGRCFRQRVLLPKNGQTRLGQRWKPTRCKKVSFARKGFLVPIPTQVDLPRPAPWLLGLQGGVLASPIGGSLLGGGAVVARRSFFALQLGVWGASAEYPRSPTSHQIYLSLRAEVGFRQRWSWLDLSAGAYASFGLLMQLMEAQGRPLLGGVFGYGATTTFHLWLHPSMGLTLTGDLGFSLLKQGGEYRNFFGASGRIGYFLRFG